MVMFFIRSNYITYNDLQCGEICSLHFYMQSNWKIKVCAKNNILINKA